ncbi:transglycosylase SLT domain-containing protein [Antarcticimicrobium sediminis]|uniref:Lytic transglycosylase n=1 Tax=Antarcticimicrobium sediminis TaxID=2546227 RepID=A0A4R5EN28_9RHOB|nr:transglycosylase SLT domain-containing protein [Antarcticimicrobium sediminis]TDE36002.1 lytic transglycosylase [Antarcticimicrobium sediminis]
MNRPLGMLIIVLLLASCGGGYKAPPRNLDNACSILAQRPKYKRAFRATERKWGVPMHVQMAVIHQESKFRSDARTPFRYKLGVIPMGRASSAYGYSQALDGTWEEYQKATGHRRAKRDRMRDASDFMGWYMTRSYERNGISLTDARNQYLAYHEGHTGYSRGSHKSKSWLLRVASDVERRASTYRAQLKSCN